MYNTVQGVLKIPGKFFKREKIEKTISLLNRKEDAVNTRYFALVLGIFYTIIGVLGFFPPLITDTQPISGTLAVDLFSGRLLGIFPVNILHNLVHLAVGIWGIVAYRGYVTSIVYSKTVAILFGVLTVMGLIPVFSTTFGLIPLFGADILLHAGTAILGAYFGFYAARVGLEVRK